MTIEIHELVIRAHVVAESPELRAREPLEREVDVRTVETIARRVLELLEERRRGWEL
ncbi:DUF5908 family protein [Pararobbsia silviterrae]|uniref:DUF5908 family protein n=1 Tax=Pararobbsia silviterrae TaxID=1792498 RepID=UPI0026CEEBB2